MPKKVYNNIEDHRLLCNGTIVEDVTSVGLPTIEHPTTSLTGVSGMAGDLELPNNTKVSAMELTVSHNNGVGHENLAVPGKRTIEFRIVRQRFDVAKTNMEHELVKYRINAFHTSTEKGNAESGNPLGSTDHFAVVRYEEIVNGKQTVLVDVPAGIISYNGKKYTDSVQNMLK